jgi:hypothetical protein
LTAIRPEQIAKILEVTDALSIHRERVLIPLRAEGQGNVEALSDGRIRIVCPDSEPFDVWLEQLRKQLQTINTPRNSESN